MTEIPKFEIPLETGHVNWFKVPTRIFFEPHSIRYLCELKAVKKIFIISDHQVYELGYVNRVMQVLRRRKNPVEIEIYIDVPIEPTMKAVKEALEVMQTYQPSHIIGIGGGSVMDAAKMMWMLYEHPEISLEEMPNKFKNLHENVFENPIMDEKSRLVCIPTTTGTGSEVSPFCVLVDEKTNKMHSLASFSFIPTIAIVDPSFTETLPKRNVADNGFDMLTHGIESFISKYSNDFSDGMALESLRIILNEFANSYNGIEDSRIQMHNASTIAGMSHGNGYLGIAHALAHKIADFYHIHHGRICGILLPHIIRFNAQKPEKEELVQLKPYNVMEKFEKICERTAIPINGNAAETIAKKCEELLIATESSTGFEECGISEDDWNEKIKIIAKNAEEEEYNNFNPRHATVEELEMILKNAFKKIN